MNLLGFVITRLPYSWCMVRGYVMGMKKETLKGMSQSRSEILFDSKFFSVCHVDVP